MAIGPENRANLAPYKRKLSGRFAGESEGCDAMRSCAFAQWGAGTRRTCNHGLAEGRPDWKGTHMSYMDQANFVPAAGIQELSLDAIA